MTTPWPDGPGVEEGPARVDGATEREGAACIGIKPGPTDSEHEHMSGGGAQEAGTPWTGLDPVDRVLAREDEISRLPVTERAAAYEDLHRELERILSEDPGKLPHGLVAAPGGWLQR